MEDDRDFDPEEDDDEPAGNPNRIYEIYGLAMERARFHDSLLSYLNHDEKLAIKMSNDIFEAEDSADSMLGTIAFHDASDNATTEGTSEFVVLIGREEEVTAFLLSSLEAYVNITYFIYLTGPSKNSFCQNHFMSDSVRSGDGYSSLGEVMKNLRDNSWIGTKIEIYFLPSTITNPLFKKKALGFLKSDAAKDFAAHRLFFIHFPSESLDDNGKEEYLLDGISRFIKATDYSLYALMINEGVVEAGGLGDGNCSSVTFLGKSDRSLYTFRHALSNLLPLKGCLTVYLEKGKEAFYQEDVAKLDILVKQGRLAFVYRAMDSALPFIKKDSIDIFFVDGENADEIEDGIQKYTVCSASSSFCPLFVTPPDFGATYPIITKKISKFHTKSYCLNPFSSLFWFFEASVDDIQLSLLSHCFSIPSLGYEAPNAFAGCIPDSRGIDCTISASFRPEFFFPLYSLQMLENRIPRSKDPLSRMLSLLPKQIWPMTLFVCHKLTTSGTITAKEIYEFVTNCYGKECVLRDFAKREHEIWEIRTLLLTDKAKDKTRYLVPFEDLEKEALDLLATGHEDEAFKKDPIFSDYIMGVAGILFYI